MKDFILPYKRILLIFVLLALVAGAQSCASDSFKNNKMVVTGQRCTVDSAYTTIGLVSLALNCGSHKASSPQGDLVVAYANDHSATFICDVRRNGEAQCYGKPEAEKYGHK